MKHLLLTTLVALTTVACQKDSAEQIVGTGTLRITPSAVSDVKSATGEAVTGGKKIAVPAFFHAKGNMNIYTNHNQSSLSTDINAS